MSTRVEKRSAELLTGKNLATISTLRSDGSIHAAPTWIDIEDGHPLLNTAEGRVWPRNLERDPRVTITAFNSENPYEYVSIRGRVIERRHEGADAHIDALAHRYLGAESYPYRQPGEQRVILVVEAEHVHHYGA